MKMTKKWKKMINPPRPVRVQLNIQRRSATEFRKAMRALYGGSSRKIGPILFALASNEAMRVLNPKGFSRYQRAIKLRRMAA
jgi:hypothetical protein